MGSYDRDRVPPVFMDHGDQDYGVHLTYTERYFESLEEPPSRIPSPVGAEALRADRQSVPGADRTVAHTHEAPASTSPSSLPAPTPEES
jgi:hypothetical protein